VCRLPLLGERAKHDSYWCAGPKPVEKILPESAGRRQRFEILVGRGDESPAPKVVSAGITPLCRPRSVRRVGVDETHDDVPAAADPPSARQITVSSPDLYDAVAT